MLTSKVNPKEYVICASDRYTWGTWGAPPIPLPSPSTFLQHSPPPWSCYQAVCQWPGCPRLGLGSAGSCPTPTPAQRSLGLSDSDPAWSPWQPIQSLDLHPDLGEGDRKLSPSNQSKGPRRGPAHVLYRGPNPKPSLSVGTPHMHREPRASSTPHTLRTEHSSPSPRPNTVNTMLSILQTGIRGSQRLKIVTPWVRDGAKFQTSEEVIMLNFHGTLESSAEL